LKRKGAGRETTREEEAADPKATMDQDICPEKKRRKVNGPNAKKLRSAWERRSTVQKEIKSKKRNQKQRGIPYPGEPFSQPIGEGKALKATRRRAPSGNRQKAAPAMARILSQRERKEG